MPKKSTARRKIDKSRARIRILVKTNPRRPKTSAGKRVGEMIAFVKRHPKHTVKEVLKKTAYRGDDLQYDLEHKFIKVVSA